MIKLLLKAEAAEKARNKSEVSKLPKQRRHGMQTLLVEQIGLTSD